MSDPTEIAKAIASRFIERRDAKAIQSRSGAYAPVREDMRDTDSPLIEWRLSDIVDHLEGRKTYGHYVVSLDGTCRTFVFDIDLRSKAHDDSPIMFRGEVIDPREVWAGPSTEAKHNLALQLRVIAEGLARRTKKILGVDVMVSYSGSKGMHVYACLDPGTPAADARSAAHTVIDSLDGVIIPDRGKNFFRHSDDDKFQPISIELFPKQDDVSAEGFGNLIRLPLGVNQKSGKPGFFLDMNTQQDEFKIEDPMVALENGSIRD